MSESASANAGSGESMGSAGALLRQAREQAGLHIGAMAVALKVPVKKIEALEADRLDLLPDAVFARALAGSICRHLKMDVKPVLNLLPRVRTDTIRSGETRLDAPFQYGQGSTSLQMAGLLKNPVAWIAGGLVLAALLVYFWPSAVTVPAKESVAVSTVPAVQEAPGRLELVVVPVGQTTPGPVVTEVQVVPPVVAQSPTTLLVQNAVPSAAVMAQIQTPNPADVGTSNPAGLVQFRAKGQSWIEVTDAAGTVQFRKTLEAGEVAGASGAMPLKVVVGRANLTTVQVRGQNFDLSALTKDNVARFEVR